MYNTNYDSATYLYSCSRQSWIASFDTEEKLVQYLAAHYDTFYGKNNDVQLTGNDTRHADFTDSCVLRDYLLMNAYNTVVDPLVYKARVDEFIDSVDAEETHHNRQRIHWRIYDKWRAYDTERLMNHDDFQRGDVLHYRDTSYRFRQDPVPGIGRKRWHFACWYRAPRTFAELRDMADPEVQPYVRKKRKLILTSYDDIPRGYQRSWKRQSKKRKQWM